MENLYVSDLFGYNITNGSPVIIINVNKTKNIFVKAASESIDNTSIWKYNKTLIDEILFERHVDPNNFLIIGHILAKSNVLPDIVILANKNICIKPQGYDEVMNYSKGKIIRPFGTSDKGKKIYSTGLFYVENMNTINSDLSITGIIPDKLLVNYSTNQPTEISVSNNLSPNSQSITLDCNDFGLLSSPQFGIKTLARTQEIAEKFKLLNGNDKYLTILDNKIVAKQGLSTLAQLFSYNAQGELINEGKCLTYKNSKVLAESCNSDSSNQKWVLSQNKILPSNNFGKCLDVSALDKTTVELNDCESSNTQQWDTELNNNIFDDTVSSQSGDYTWAKYKGKTLALVENDNPWFVNTDMVIPMKVEPSATNRYDDFYFREMPHYQPNFLVNLRNNQAYKTDFIIDPESQTLGYGYSYKSRGGKPCTQIPDNSSNIEHFDGDQSQQKYSFEQQIFVIIILLAIILVLYKAWKSNQ